MNVSSALGRGAGGKPVSPPEEVALSPLPGAKERKLPEQGVARPLHLADLHARSGRRLGSVLLLLGCSGAGAAQVDLGELHAVLPVHWGPAKVGGRC